MPSVKKMARVGFSTFIVDSGGGGGGGGLIFCYVENYDLKPSRMFYFSCNIRI